MSRRPSRIAAPGRHPADREILRLALPALGALAAEPLYILTDTAVVGHLGTPQLGGLAVAGTIPTTPLSPFKFLSYGTTAARAPAGRARPPQGSARHARPSPWAGPLLGGGAGAGGPPRGPPPGGPPGGGCRPPPWAGPAPAPPGGPSPPCPRGGPPPPPPPSPSSGGGGPSGGGGGGGGRRPGPPSSPGSAGGWFSAATSPAA